MSLQVLHQKVPIMNIKYQHNNNEQRFQLK